LLGTLPTLPGCRLGSRAPEHGARRRSPRRAPTGVVDSMQEPVCARQRMECTSHIVWTEEPVGLA
jgi:hypothetical protein